MTANITNEYLATTGWAIEAAPVDAWRHFDEHDPVPGYFQFDWFSSYHPDLYHRFALSTEGLMDELERLVDLSGLVVADIGGGTGRSTQRLAKKAKHVFAIDPFKAVLIFSRHRIEQAGITNVTFKNEPCTHITLPDNSVDASVSAWAVMDFAEAYRITKPGGFLIFMGAAPGALCAELTATLAPEYPTLIEQIASAEVFDPIYPSQNFEGECVWNEVPLVAPRHIQDFTFVADYGDCSEAAAIYGRLYGPKAKTYLQKRSQSTVSWRLRIEVARIAK